MRIHNSALLTTMLLLMSAWFGWALAADKETPKESSPKLENHSADSPMTNSRLERLIKRIDENAQGRTGFWTFTVQDHSLAVITDQKVNRMRIISAIGKSEDLPQDELYRLMQANFDSSLDARYAIAKETLWSAFIHPLSTLTDRDFLSGIGQVVNLVETLGSSYSSGLLIFRDGDSGEIQRRELIDRLMKKGLSI